MASLTPLSKGLIGLAVIGAMASAVWNLVLKDHLADAPPAAAQNSPQPAQTDQPSSSVVATHPSEPVAFGGGQADKGDGLSAAENAEQGRRLMESGDFTAARSNLERAVQGGDAGAACHLGEMTLKGQGGLAADQNAAAQLFQLAQSRNTICFAPNQ